MKLGKKNFDEQVQAAFEGTKKALGNDRVRAATDNAARKTHQRKLADEKPLLQLRRRLGVSEAQFSALQGSAKAWAAHGAKQATTLYDRATGSRDKKSLLHHEGLERRAANIAAERHAANESADAAAVRGQLTREVHALVQARAWSPQHKQVVENLAADLISFAERLPSEQARAQRSRGNFVQRFGERNAAKASVLAAQTGNAAARAGNRASQGVNSAVRGLYDVATSSVAAVAVGAGVTVVGAVLPWAFGTRLAWNAGVGVAEGARGVGQALKQAARDGADATRTRNARDRKATSSYFGPRNGR